MRTKFLKEMRVVAFIIFVLSVFVMSAIAKSTDHSQIAYTVFTWSTITTIASAILLKI